MQQYLVYIMTNKSRTLYTGITNDLQRRVYEHRGKLLHGFTSRYNITKLVYFEAIPNIREAITREKQIKGWLRSKKIALIESVNPNWIDLSSEWSLSDQTHRRKVQNSEQGARHSERSEESEHPMNQILRRHERHNSSG